MAFKCFLKEFSWRGQQTVASFPGLPTVQFLIACSMQKQRGKAWYHLSCEWHQKIERAHFTHEFFVLNRERYAFRFANVQNSSTWGRKYKIWHLARSFDRGPLPPSVYLGRHWRHSRDKWYQAFPLRFCILQAIKNWTVGRPGNEAKQTGVTWGRPSLLMLT